jgi:hypothetical protein
MKYPSGLFFLASEFIFCSEFIEDRLTCQAFCRKSDAIAMHIPKQAPTGFIDPTYIAQIDCLFQIRGTQVRRLPALFERSDTRAAQFSGNLESQMAVGLLCLNSDHAISRTSVFRPPLSEKAFEEP